MTACQFCDFEAPAGATHCPSCGAELPVHAAPENRPSLETELLALLDTGNVIGAIKRHREATGMGLAESKRLVEALQATGSLDTASATTKSDAPALEAEVLGVLSRDGKIAAVKVYRDRTKVGLKEAKEAVEAIAARHGVVAKTAGCFGMLVFACSAIALLFALTS